MGKAEILNLTMNATTSKVVVFGVCAAGDPRIDPESRQRSVNIIKMISDSLANRYK